MKNYSPLKEGPFTDNVTIKVISSLAEQWLPWLLKEHIPEIMNTACFTEYRVLKLLDIDDNEGPT